MTPFQKGFQKRAEDLANGLGDADAARMMQILAQQQAQDPSQAGAISRFAPATPNTQFRAPQVSTQGQPGVSYPKTNAPGGFPTPVVSAAPTAPAPAPIQSQTPTVDPQKPTGEMFKTSSYRGGFVKRATEYGFNPSEISRLCKAAEDEMVQQPKQNPAPTQEPAPQQQGQEAIPPELLQQLIMMLHQQNPQGAHEVQESPQHEQAETPNKEMQEKVLAFLAAQNQGGQKPVA